MKSMKRPDLPENILAFFRKTGAMGGKSRADKHTKEQLSAWGKLGGRPKGSGKKKDKKPAKKGGK